MRWTPLLLLGLAALPAPAVRPAPAAGPLPPVRPGCERWLVTWTQAPELTRLRDAVRAGADARVAAEIDRLQDEARARATALAAALAAPLAGGQGAVVHSYWLVPVCVVDLPPAAVGGLQRLPGVRALHRCGRVRPW